MKYWVTCCNVDELNINCFKLKP